MVKVTFDYGNKEDHTLIQEMIGGQTAAPTPRPMDVTPEQAVAAEKEAPKPPAPDTPAPVAPEPETTPVVEAPAPVAKTITAAEALPKVAAYCQANGLDKPQAYFAKVGKANIHDLTPEQIIELLTELGIEV